jgi:putative aminopeptidase FrvX
MMKLLKSLCEIQSPSGEEKPMKDFIMEYVNSNMHKWSAQPEIIEGPQFQDNLVLKFGTPRTAIFAHMDTVGFTVRYHDQLIPIGQPDVETGYKLMGSDDLGPIICELLFEEDAGLRYKFPRAIQRGTSLVFQPDFRANGEFVQCAGLDNRLGVYVALKVAETLQDGLILFSCWEEHGGGAVPVLAKYMYEQHTVSQALIADITWVTEGVEHGKGVAISMRDRNIPRQDFIKKITKMALQSGIEFQLEVEGSGSSDGRELQLSPYPIDWCFIGAAEKNVHSPNEIVHKHDIDCMIGMYGYLMERL